MSKVPNIYLAIISVDNLCLLQQYKWPEHNQNEIAAINHQTRYGPNFMTILDFLQGQTMDLFLKISVLHANFCWVGDLGKNKMSLLLGNRQFRVFELIWCLE